MQDKLSNLSTYVYWYGNLYKQTNKQTTNIIKQEEKKNKNKNYETEAHKK